MKSYMKYVIGVVGLIVVIIVLVIGFNLLRSIFSPSKPARQQQPEIAKTISLLDAGKAGSPVRFTVRGSIKGDEQHRSIRITIDDAARKVEVLQGYNDEVIKTQETQNTQDAYNAFISAINGAGFSNSVKPEGRGDEKQSCPLGQRLNYEINPGASDTYRAWGTSCGRQQGTFTGNTELVRRLFQLQVPNYNEFVRGTTLS